MNIEQARLNQAARNLLRVIYSKEQQPPDETRLSPLIAEVLVAAKALRAVLKWPDAR